MSNATNIHVTVFMDDGDVESTEQPLVPRKNGRDFIASAALEAVLSGGEGSSGRVVNKCRTFNPRGLQNFFLVALMWISLLVMPIN